jgi:hypothetical protein
MQDSGVDLRLAVNYVPACVCFFKSSALLCVLSAIHALQSVPCYAPVALAVALDRLSAPVVIFDGNGVLLSLFLAHGVNHAREGLRAQLETPAFVVSLLWALLAGLALLECPIPFLRQRGLQGLFVEMALFVTLMAFLPIDHESYVVRIVRGLIFVLLGFAWTYVIGIHQRRMAHPADSAVHFAVYFSPVLYVNGFLALAYSGLALLSLVALMRREGAVSTGVAVGARPDPGGAVVEYDEGIVEMEEAFRQAKALRATQAGGVKDS